MSDPADLGVVDAAAALERRELSSRELVTACLARIRERDGTRSADGDPGSVNAWVRVYEEDALAAADRADERLAAGDAPVAVRDPDRPQGHLRGRRQAADRLEPRARRGARARLRCLGPAGGRGHGAARAPPHARVRSRRHDRPGRQPVGARSLGRRLERRLGGRPRRPDGARGHGHGHGRVAAHPVGDVRHVDDQADARPRPDARHRPALRELRPRRADGPSGARLRAAAGRDGRRRAAGRAAPAAP